jgi:hypothetical protein
MPPPDAGLEMKPLLKLPTKAELLTVSVPWLKMPPPKSAELADRVELVTVNEPLLEMPPSSPWVMVRWARVAWTPLSTWSTRLALEWFPSTVTPLPPSIVTAAVLAGRLNSSRVPPRTIGPVTPLGSNAMVSACPSCRVPLICPRIWGLRSPGRLALLTRAIASRSDR